MSYNGSGTFNITTTGQPVVTGTVISSTAFNALTADLATGLSTAITKDGQTTTTARIGFAQGVSSTLTTDATSATTGSIITAGGISTQKALWVGTTSTFAGTITAAAANFSGAQTNTVAGVPYQWTGNGATVYPANTSGGAVSYNFSNGNAEVSFWNTASGGPTNSFIWRQMTSASSNTALMTLDSSGNLGVGGASPASVWRLYSETAASNATAIIGKSTHASYAGVNIISMTTAAASAGCYYFAGQSSAGATNNILIYGNGSVQNTNNSYGAISDIKLKQDIILAGSQWNDIKAIGALVSKYHLKSDPTGPLQIGLIAQDLQKVSPGLVYSSKHPGEDDETLGVNYSVLYMKAVKALGEALERIETLEARVAALESK